MKTDLSKNSICPTNKLSKNNIKAYYLYIEKDTFLLE